MTPEGAATLGVTPPDAAAGAATRRSRLDAAGVLGLALAVRLAVVAWAASRFPPASDGVYYEKLAERVGAGLGYTWLWPDGVVTYAAHYPVGYPGAVGLLYAVFGPHPAAAMRFNAALGALAALAVHRLAARAGSRRVAAAAGLLVALHPGLVAYTPALMTEGVTGALLACAAWAAARAREGGRGRAEAIAALGLLLGAATLVRPQSIVLAPLLGLLAGARGQSLGRRAMVAGATIAIALAACAPWTLRNCARMHRCALVSVNGGWNLLIGADPASTGAWSPIQVPDACREVFDEAEKDACFGREATRYIAAHPAEWLSLVPRKLAATFDYAGAAGFYLHESNAAAFGEDAKVALGAVETVYERAVLLLALAWVGRKRDGESRGRWVLPAVIAGAGAAALVTLHAWLSYAALLVAALARGREIARGPVLPSATLLVLATTLLMHAVFFGAGRYGMVVFPLLCGVAALALERERTG